ncbi:hypothetical protein ACIOZM_14580 [Pseudomonas sp. NPDC087346]|uniref:hypothetical protein n=1 Tax=Pseudomonas sp. NPDC087346 TaxID=3364438 RepID=UPI00381FBEBF
MKFFTNKNSRNTSDQYVSVNCDIKAKISRRVSFHTQNIEFEQSENSDQMVFLARNYENGFKDSKRGMYILCSSDLESGSYSPKDPNFPFSQFYYFESGYNGKFTTFYEYPAESGTIDVEVVENSSEALLYLIKFDFKGNDHRAGVLHIVGEAELNVFKRSA